MLFFPRYLKALPLLLVGVCLPLSAMNTDDTALSADKPKIYQFEMIVFSQSLAQELASEHWSAVSPSDFSFANASAQQTQNYLQSIHFQRVPQRYFMLKREQARLSANPNYRVLAHFAWREQVPSPADALPIHIYGGNSFTSQADVNGYSLDEEQRYDSATTWQVNGNVNLSLNRYFDVRFNLLFAEPTQTLGTTIANNPQFSNSNLAYFHLLQTRRTRSKELNYIDYPLYGIVFMIKEVTPEEAKEPMLPPQAASEAGVETLQPIMINQ